MEIRKAVQNGDIEDAVSRVNDLNPEVRLVELARLAQLPCHLRRQ